VEHHRPGESFPQDRILTMVDMQLKQQAMKGQEFYTVQELGSTLAGIPPYRSKAQREIPRNGV
jgi:hypothetical protein